MKENSLIDKISTEKYPIDETTLTSRRYGHKEEKNANKIDEDITLISCIDPDIFLYTIYDFKDDSKNNSNEVLKEVCNVE